MTFIVAITQAINPLTQEATADRTEFQITPEQITSRSIPHMKSNRFSEKPLPPKPAAILLIQIFNTVKKLHKRQQRSLQKMPDRRIL